MNLIFEQIGSTAIVYDADCIPQPSAEWFRPEYWCRTGSISAIEPGRGNTLMLETPFGEAVLRPYLRGGWPARLIRDRYFFTGFQRSRPMMEVGILVAMLRKGLPVPEPVAACCERRNLSYTGALMMRKIPQSRPLAVCLNDLPAGASGWFLTGQCIRRFHREGVIHPDLNARNILLGRQNEIHLIDFDRAVIRKGAKHAYAANLARLRRSLGSIWPVSRQISELDTCWKGVIEGYNTVA